MQSRPETRRGRIEYQPALDGLRGIALFAILAFHSEFAWARGGFLPLPTFFVLSGYLITALFLAEWDATGTIRLGAFWSRRLRRLMPAALLGLGGVSLFGLFFATDDQLARLQADVLWALAYLANWRFVFVEAAYTRLFEAPSPIQHFWSLAVEEQFYLVYPLIVVAGLRLGRGSRRLFGGILATIALLSLAVSCVLVLGSETVDRVYYGTDSRAAELAVGCLLALVLAGQPSLSERLRRALQIAGVACLAVMLWLWTFVDLEWRWLYMGGLFGYALLTAVVIAAAVQPSGPVRTFLSGRFICWAGRISYGVYVYHWPIFLVLSAERTGLDAWPLFALRLVVTFALAALSHAVLETPIRTGRVLTGWRPVVVTPAAIAAVAVAVTIVAGQGGDDLEDLASAQAALEEMEVETFAAGLEPPPSRGRERPRVAVYGDSTALRIGLALGKHYRESSEATPRRGDAQMGCGIVEEGAFLFQGKLLERPKRCADRSARYGESLEKGQPDVVVVLFGPWDVLDRRLPGDRAFRRPGDPVLDALLQREMEGLVDLLSRDGALVVWLTGPPIRVRGPGNVMPRRPFPESDPARMQRFNTLVRDLALRRSGDMRVVDLAGYMETLPGGVFDETYRPDGIHTTKESAARIAEDWLADAILSAYRAEGPVHTD